MNRHPDSPLAAYQSSHTARVLHENPAANFDGRPSLTPVRTSRAQHIRANATNSPQSPNDVTVYIADEPRRGKSITPLPSPHKPGAVSHDSPFAPTQDQHDRNASEITIQSHQAALQGHQDAPEQRGVFNRAKKQLTREMSEAARGLVACVKPAETDHHWVLFLPVLICSILIVFTFMAGQMPYWNAYQAAQECQSVPRSNPANVTQCYMSSFSTPEQGPEYFQYWIKTTGLTFPFEFMRSWGGHYVPDIGAGQGYRWITSQFVHVSLSHLIGNVLMLLVLGVPLERRFGLWRVILVWFMAVVGGSLLSTAVEDPCTQVVGASGGIFGLVGMYVSELVLARHHLDMPIYRAVTTLVFFAVFLVTSLKQTNVSHMTHLGGFLCGFVPTFLILPNQKKDCLQRFLPYVGAVGFVTIFAVLFAYDYKVVIPNVQCPI